MQLFELFGTILLKDSGIENQLDKIDKKASGTSVNMDGAFKKIAGAALTLGGIIGAGMGFKDMIDKASAGQDRLAQMDSVLKSTGGAAGMTKDELLKLADAQGKLTTFSKGANIETENLLLTFTNIGQKTFPDALSAVNDMSQALGQDTKSSAIQLGKALNDPIKGITALSRVGVSFTEQQKEQIAAMVKAGDTAGAQSVILKELQKEFGGSAEAAGKTFSGQLTILKNQLSGVGASLGMTVIPYLTNFITSINNNMPVIKQVITDVINVVVPKFEEWIKLIGQIASELFPSFTKSTKDAKTGSMELVKDGLNLVTGILTWIRDNIGLVKAGVEGLTAVWLIQKGVLIAHNAVMALHKIAQLADIMLNGTEETTTGLATAALIIHKGAVLAGTAAQWLFNAAMDANPIGLVIIALAALGLAIYEVVKHWQEIVTWIEKAWDWLTKWNGTDAKDKNINVMTGKTVKTSSNPIADYIGHNAAGTDNWRGGLTEINEYGGEIVDLPSGTRIIPHDISEEMAQNNKNYGDNKQPVIVQLILENGAKIAEWLMPDLDKAQGQYTYVLSRGL